MFWTLVIAAMVAVGCAKSPAAPAPSDPASGGGEAATPGDDPEGTKVTCHLECSGTEATGTGATEEEARADVKQYIDQNCKPEDGQYFIFCDPPQ